MDAAMRPTLNSYADIVTKNRKNTCTKSAANIEQPTIYYMK